MKTHRREILIYYNPESSSDRKNSLPMLNRWVHISKAMRFAKISFHWHQLAANT